MKIGCFICGGIFDLASKEARVKELEALAEAPHFWQDVERAQTLIAMPKGVRSSGVGTIYAVSASAFGGSTQFMIKWLSGLTHSPLAPAWYLTAALVIGAVAMGFTPETAPVRVGLTSEEGLAEGGGPQAG